MTAKTLKAPERQADFGTVLIDLFEGRRKKPPIEAARQFSKALDDHFLTLIHQTLGQGADERAPVVAAKVAELTSAFELTSERKAGGGVAQAIEDGLRFKSNKLSQPDMLSSTVGAARAGITRQALDDRRKNRTALGLSGNRRGYKYPDWQFEDLVLGSIGDVMAALASRDEWGCYLFFTQPEPMLGGLTPLAALRLERRADVVRVAKAIEEA